METYHGQVKTPADAIILFEACRLGHVPRVQRRLSEKERQHIKSGSIFVWDEREAGMRRWTDGKSWSASRVSGSFLTYREMEGKRGGSSFAGNTASPSMHKHAKSDDGEDGGDAPDGYRYKPDGLVKQSFSITTSQGQHLHLISYYARSHPASSTLQQPTSDASLRHIRPAKGMYPDSTIHEANGTAAVPRSPMGTSPYAQSGSQNYLRHSPMVGQNSYAYPSPMSTPGTSYFPSPHQLPLHGPAPTSNGYLGSSLLGYPSSGYNTSQSRGPGPTAFDRAPPPMSNPNWPPPPPPQPHQQRYSPPQQQPAYLPARPTSLQHGQFPSIAPSYVADHLGQTQHTYSVHSHKPISHQVDPRLQLGPVPPPQSPSAQQPTPPYHNSNPSIDKEKEKIQPARTIPSINALINKEPTPSQSQPYLKSRASSGMTSDRLGMYSGLGEKQKSFGSEDTRALRQLDRAFAGVI